MPNLVGNFVAPTATILALKSKDLPPLHKKKTEESRRSPSFDSPEFAPVEETISQHKGLLSPSEHKSRDGASSPYVQLKEHQRLLTSSGKEARGWSGMVPSLSPEVVSKNMNMTSYKQRHSAQMSRTFYGNGF